MVALEFLAQLDKFRFVDSVGLDDFADRCSYMLSFLLIVCCFTIVTLKSYVFEPMSCYAPTTFSGANIGPYINAFCWVNGTIPLDVETEHLDNPAYWESLEYRKVSYYQWVSLVLALQAILCYLPRLIWESITFNRVGTNLGFLIESAQAASNESGKERANRVRFVANVMDTLLFARRKLLRESSGDNLNERSTIQLFFDQLSGLLPRKRLGTALAFYYMVIKFLYLSNAIGQLLIMQKFLGLNGNYRLFGLAILNDLLNGRHWNETHIFPRVGFCRVPIKLTATPIPMVTVQCTLPVNMLNEKIYVFLWFWFVFVSTLEVISVITWIYRLAARQSRLNLLVRYLRIADSYNHSMDPLLTRFEMTFLRLDGSFLLQMLRLNCGSLITQEILKAMLDRYIKQEESVLAQKKLVERPHSQPHHQPSDIEKASLLTDCTLTKRLDAV